MVSDELTVRILSKVRPVIEPDEDGWLLLSVGPNTARAPTLGDAMDHLLDQALEHYGAWGFRWKEKNDG